MPAVKRDKIRVVPVSYTHLLQRDSWLGDLEVTNAGLEEAFLALTQNHNTDASKGKN